MEFLAIVILAASTLLSFSTTSRKPKPKTTIPGDYDADFPFIEGYDFDDNSREGWLTNDFGKTENSSGTCPAAKKGRGSST